MFCLVAIKRFIIHLLNYLSEYLNGMKVLYKIILIWKKWCYTVIYFTKTTCLRGRYKSKTFEFLMNSVPVLWSKACTQFCIVRSNLYLNFFLIYCASIIYLESLSKQTNMHFLSKKLARVSSALPQAGHPTLVMHPELANARKIKEIYWVRCRYVLLLLLAFYYINASFFCSYW